MVKPDSTTPVVKTYPNKLYGESPVKTIIVWIVGVVIMTQFVSWYISVGLETALYSGIEMLAAAAAAAAAHAAAVPGASPAPLLTPAEHLALIHSAIDAIHLKIDMFRTVASIPILIFVGFVGAHYLIYTILACLVGIMIAGSIIIGSITGRSEDAMPDLTNGPWKFVVAHGLIESVFVPVLMIACILFLIQFLQTAQVFIAGKRRKFFTPVIIVLIAMGVHNVNNTRMGMAHGWTATWSSLRIGMIIAMVILGPLFAAGVVIRMKLLKTIPRLEESVALFPEEQWKTIQILGILVGIVVTFQEVILRYYNAAMTQVVGTGGAPVLAGISGILGIGIHLYTCHKWSSRFKETILDYFALGSCAVSAICLLLPVGAMNNFFAHRSSDVPVRAAGALVVGLLIIYTAFPILMARIAQLTLRHTRSGFEFMAKCLLLAFFAVNRILPCLSYHNNRHAAWSHIVTSIGLVIASMIYIALDSKQEERLAASSTATPNSKPLTSVNPRDIERQISIESTISSIPTMVVLSPRVLKAPPPTDNCQEGIVPPNNSLRYPTISTFDEF